MPLTDVLYVLQWWLVLFAIGIAALPLTAFLFPHFFDRAYAFTKTLGIILVSYVIFLLGIARLLPFTQATIFLVLMLLLGVSGSIVLKREHVRASLIRSWKIFFLEELVFLIALFFWSFIRAHQPDIHGLEKFMDFGFLNSILRAEYFPPKDMWLTPFSINYYYFGHLTTAVLTKLSLLPSSVTYNLMLATIFALTFTGAFSIGANLLWFNVLLRSKATKDLERLFVNTQNDMKKIFVGGFLSAFLVTLSGNLHSIYAFFKPYVNENPVPFWQLVFSPETFPNAYWYPNATRFIYNTIHEFPLYSFVVSDLHGHVLDIPIVLLTIAVLLSLMQNAKVNPFNFSLLTLLAFLLAVLYMTNAWDGLIYFGLTILILFYLWRKYLLKSLALVVLVLIGSILFSLPFSLSFTPFVSGIGTLCAPSFLTSMQKLGPLLFEPDHCQRSLLWQLLILHGFWYFWILIFVKRFLKIKTFGHWNLFRNWRLEIRNLLTTDVFVFLLILISTFLILTPEFIYVKDIYPAHYRANTMFKLTYQAFIMLSLASAYTIIRQMAYSKWHIANLIGSIGLFLVSIYPYFAINSYYGNLKMYHGLDGSSYLKTLYPSDYEALVWLAKNVKGQPVILEAQGDSYTDYARVSANTGLPTVLGWTVHEWLWRGSYDVPSPRIAQVQTLYETADIETARKLIEKYHVAYVFVGDLERQKYEKLNEEKFGKLGQPIYRKGKTVIYQILQSFSNATMQET